MAENIIGSPESDTNDDLVPTFSKTLGKFVFSDGVEFNCNINTVNKINKERSFTGFSTNNDDEEE
jgi:hypothetical protein